MRHRSLSLWYVLLVIFVVEFAAYGLTGLMTNGYRKLMWERFNVGVQEYHDANSGLPYAEMINRYARAEGISGQVVAVVIKAESSFRPRALSSAGAYGLMQIMPSTWRQINNEIKVCVGRHTGECNSDCFFDPELNIRVGTAYLSRLYKANHGDMVLALASYNAGPGEVSRYGGVPPYKETNHYIDRIITYWYTEQHKALPPYGLKAEYWQEVHTTLGWLCAITGGLIGVMIWRLLKRYHSWRWR